MDIQFSKNISNFFVAGINYKKTDASVRGNFAIDKEQYENLLGTASSFGFTELFILSTCNRTEIYGFAQHSEQLIDLLCAHTTGCANTFKNLAYIKNGAPAIEHLFSVSAGLDSQILGDYEIVGQLKSAVKFAKERCFIGAFTERLVNCVLQASKTIKNNTKLSSGTVSVSFAAVQYLRDSVVDCSSKNILLLGVGKIGRNACKNLVHYLCTKNITLINRSPEKAIKLAAELGLRSSSIEHIRDEIKNADVIIVATNSTKPIILKEHLEGSGKKIIVDLSIPYNVEASASELDNIEMINVDELSKRKDETLTLRQSEIPKAQSILKEAIFEFHEWYDMRKHVPMLKNLKLKLKEIHTHPGYSLIPPTSATGDIDKDIQKVLNDTAGKVKIQNNRGCHYISAINDFISAP